MSVRFVLTTGLLIGIVVGSAIFVSIVIIGITFLVRRAKRAHRQALIAEHHSNRSLQRHLNIRTSESQYVPGDRNVVQSKRLARASYGRDFTEVASCDSLVRRSALLNSAWPGHSTTATKIARPSRPMPQGLIRSKAIPSYPIKTLRPITEKTHSSMDLSIRSSTRSKEPHIVPFTQPNRFWSFNDVNSFRINSPLSASDSDKYAPKPLFHCYNISHSNGDVSDFRAKDVFKPTPIASSPIQFDNYCLNNMAASCLNSESYVSMQSEQFGNAPIQPMPDIPANELAHLWNHMPGGHDGFDTQLHSPMTSCASIHSSILDLNDIAHDPPCNADHPSLRIQSSDQFTIPNVRSQMLTQQSLTPKIEEYDLTRSPSSGLAPSLIDRLVPRDNSIVTNLSGRQPKTCANPERNIPYSSTFDAYTGNFESSVNFMADQDRQALSFIHNGSKNKLASTSILQSCSQTSPPQRPTKKRPSSFPSSRHLDWNNSIIQPGKPSAMKRRSNGHKRQGRVRISFVAPVTTPTRSVTTVQERDETIESLEILEIPGDCRESIIPGILASTSNEMESSLCPPPRANFDPQLNLSPRMADQEQDDYYFATMSMCNFHDNVFDHPPDFTTSTPKDSSQHQTSYKLQDDYDRFSLALNDLELALITSPRLRSDLNKHSLFNSGLSKPCGPSSHSTSIPETRPPSFLFSFPNPTVKHQTESKQPSTPTVRGPRADPLRMRSSTRRSPSGSPTRPPARHPQRPSPLRNVIKVTPPQSSSSLLATNVKQQIRRHNSDAVTLDPNERKNYLHMGGRASILEEGPSDHSDIMLSSMLGRLSPCRNEQADVAVESPYTMASRGAGGTGVW
ncbi:hypothetical protein MMC14_007226 [Varicellaria rhodocarpa]|nr:hypothetical protein [Varicellaria rhodocarpa]